MTNILAALGLIFTAVVSLLSALLVPGGIATRLAGLAVVGRDGASIGRLRSVVRALITWSPALVWCAWLWLGPRVQGWVPAPRSPLLPALAAFGMLAAGAAWTLTRPARGPHDIIAGTWVAPR